MHFFSKKNLITQKTLSLRSSVHIMNRIYQVPLFFTLRSLLHLELSSNISSENCLQSDLAVALW